MRALYFFLLAASLSAQTFTPKANSPIALGEHPRLFFTRSQFSDLKSKIADFYLQDYQEFAEFMNNFGSPSGLNWNEIAGAARSYALLYQIPPSDLGLTGRDKVFYGQRAREFGLYIATRLSNTYNEAHHGASTLSGKAGGLPVLALQIVYDWCYDALSLSDRKQIAQKLINLYSNRYARDRVKLENHYTANAHVYAGALCFYGDSDLGFDNEAQTMMNGFQDVFIESQLGVAERVYAGGSDWHEGDSYSMDAYLSLMFLSAAAETALGEDFFNTNDWLKYAAYYIYFSTNPGAFNGTYFFKQTDTHRALSLSAIQPSNVMSIIAARVKGNIGSFASWFVGLSPYGQRVENWKYYKPNIYDFFYKFVFGFKYSPPKNPTEAGIPLYHKNNQTIYFRSDHKTDGTSTLINFFATKYFYPNGHNENEATSFNIYSRGSLVIGSVNTKNSGSDIPSVSKGKAPAFNNVIGVGGGRMEWGLSGLGSKQDDPDDYVDGSKTHIGTVEKFFDNNVIGYARYNFSKGNKFADGFRELLYYRPENILIVRDSVSSSLRKRWLIHTPNDLKDRGGYWEMQNNRGGSDGRFYLTSILPAQKDIVQYSPGWYDADGNALARGPFSDKAAWLLSETVFQINSNESEFLNVFEINTQKNTVKGISGGVMVGNNVFVFGGDSFVVTANGDVNFVITNQPENIGFKVYSGTALIDSGNTGGGVVVFSDALSGVKTYQIAYGANVSDPTPDPIPDPAPDPTPDPEPDSDVIVIKPGDSITDALKTIQPGDSLILTAGEYMETPRFVRGGTSLDKIYIGARGKVIIKHAGSIKPAGYIVFDGIEFDHLSAASDAFQISTDGNQFINCKIYNGQRDGIDISSGDKNIIESCEIFDFVSNRDAHAVVLSNATNTQIRNSKLHGVSGDGVQIYHGTSSGTLIEYNEMFGRPGLGENAVDIKRSKDVVVRGNKIHGFRRTSGSRGDAIVIHHEAVNIIIEENEIFNTNGGIRIDDTAEGVPQDVIVRRNILRDIVKEQYATDGYGFGIDGAINIKLYNNVLSNIAGPLFWIDKAGADGLDVRNNIFINGKSFSGGVSNLTGTTIFAYNAWNNCEQTVAGTGDLLNVDLKIDSLFYPQSDSPLINAGDPAFGVNYPGGRIDIGRYEYDSPLPDPVPDPDPNPDPTPDPDPGPDPDPQPDPIPEPGPAPDKDMARFIIRFIVRNYIESGQFCKDYPGDDCEAVKAIIYRMIKDF